MQFRNMFQLFCLHSDKFLYNLSFVQNTLFVIYSFMTVQLIYIVDLFQSIALLPIRKFIHLFM